MRIKIILYGLLVIQLLACVSSTTTLGRGSLVKGVYGNPAALWEAGYDFSSLGVNAVFVRSGSLNQEFIDRAKKIRPFEPDFL